MNSGKVFKWAIISLAVIFIIHQAFSSFYKPITTETALFHSGTEGIDISGFIVRNEMVVTEKANGALHFLVEDGTRVAKDGTIAQIYDSESASITVSEIENLKGKIEDMKNIIAYNNLDATDLDTVNNKLNAAINELVITCSAGQFSEVEKAKQELLSIINRKQMVIGATTDFTPQLEELEARVNSLEASLPSVKDKIKAEISGYFASSSDGYENSVDISKLSKITPEEFAKIEPSEKPKNVIGKIVSDYEWYIVAKISMNDSLTYKEGESVKISTSLKTAPTLSAKVKHINVSDVGEDAIIVLSCSQMSSEIAAIRTAPMTLVKTEYSGLKVSRKALRVADSKTGVFVVNSMQVKFVPVNVVFSNDDYIICEQLASDSDVLRLYDEVIVKGRNLYDGKIIG